MATKSKKKEGKESPKSEDKLKKEYAMGGKAMKGKGKGMKGKC